MVVVVLVVVEAVVAVMVWKPSVQRFFAERV
jgi:hypothetical protein